MKNQFKILSIVFCASALIWTTGCNAPPAKPDSSGTPVAQASPRPVQTVVQDVQNLGDFANALTKERAAEISAQHTEQGFDEKVVGLKRYANAYLYLAATAQDDALRYNSLEQLQHRFTAGEETKDKLAANQDYDNIVLFYLNSPDPFELMYAIKASKHCFRADADADVMTKVVEIGMTHSEAAARRAALEAFADAKVGENKSLLELFVKSFTDEDIVALTALQSCRGELGKSEASEDVKAALLKTLEHPQPHIRGCGILALAREFSDDPDLVIEGAKPLLGDKSAFVRAKALEAIGLTDDPRVLELAGPLLDDPAPTAVGIGYRNLLGEEDVVTLSTSGWNRVDGAAIKAVEMVSKTVSDKPFALGKVNPASVGSDVTREVGLAKKWLAANKG